VTSPSGPEPVAGFAAVHHVGVTVADLDRSLAFWEALLGVAARDHRTLEGPVVSTMVGYPDVRIRRCWVDLPGGVALELLEYLDRPEAPNPAGNAHPGNVHVCLLVDDMGTAHPHAVACGAQPVSDAPVEVRAGPLGGARLAYVRDPDGVTIELFQPPPGHEARG
jgi:catechol 2,3-dioxygenase-like lactoylglutathione lyase family enzyme